MPSPASAPIPAISRIASHVWWIVLFAGLALFCVATKRRIDRVDVLTNSPVWSVDSPPRDRASPTGFAHGQRTLIVPGLHTPSFWWIAEAQQTAHQHQWRLRQVASDALSQGRETRRTAPYRWWLIVVGWLRASFTGDPLGSSIEQGALVADPILFALTLVVGTLYVVRYFGSMAAVGFVVAATSVYPLAADFAPGAPDPHALAWVFALGSFLPLLVPARKLGRRAVAPSDVHGAVRLPPNERLGNQAPLPSGIDRRHFILAGIFGGLGLWNDASTQAPLLLATALGGIACELINARDPADLPVVRARWRAWALAGALTTLAASAFEFAPNHFSWSLDAINPIHAVVWWGFGELLHAVAMWRVAGRRGFHARSVVLLNVALLAVGSWPVVGALSHSGGLRAPDFYARELANDARAISAPSLGDWLHQPGDAGMKWTTVLPIAVVVIVLLRLVFGGGDREERGRLLFGLVAAVFVGALALLQLRWWNLFDGLVLAMLAALLTGAKRARWKTLGAVLFVSPGAFVGFPPVVEGNQLADISPADAQQLVARDFSYWLTNRGGPDPDVVLSTPIFSTAMAYYGGCDVIVAADDEDPQGLLAAARMATASTLDEASVLLRTRGVTRIVLPLWDPMVPNLVRTGRNLPADAPLPDDTFFVGLLRWGSPVWLQAMNYVVPAQTGLQDFQLVCYAVRTPMEVDLFLGRLADFFVERGMLHESESVAQSLKDYPRSVVALGAVARVELARNDQEDLARTVEKLIPYLSRVTARHLPADRRISIATVLFYTRHPDLARNQIAACLDGLDREVLRTLSPGAVRDLLTIMRADDLSFPDPALKPAALSLLPPGERARFAP